MLPLPIDVSDHNPVPSNVSALFLAGYGGARLKAAVGLGSFLGLADLMLTDWWYW